MTNSTDEKQLDDIVSLVVMSGVMLNLLLPIGVAVGIKNPLFLGTFLFGTLPLVFAALLSLHLYLRSLRSLRSKVPLLIVTLFAVTTIIVTAALPITARDALIHHLAVPSWWVAADEIFIPGWHPWSRYPMNLQLAYCGLVSLGLDRLTPYYHLLYHLILSTLTLVLVVRVIDNKLLGQCGFLLCLTLPALLRLSTIPLVDLSLTLYSLIVIESLTSLRRGSFTSAGLALGLALSTKPNGLLFFGAVLLSFFVCRVGERGVGIVRETALLSALALVVYLPWYLRPIQPTLWSASSLKQETIPSPSLLPQPLRARTELYGESYLEVIAIPFRIFFEGRDDSGKSFDGVIGPLFITGLIPLGLFTPKLRLITLVTLIYLVGALLLGPTRIRYLAPILPLIVITTIYNLQALFRRVRLSEGVVVPIIGGQLLFNAAYLYQLTSRLHVIQYLQGGLRDEEILFRALPEYDMIRFINGNLSDKTLTYLLLTGNRFYYYRRPVITAGHMSADPIIAAVRGAQTPEDIRRFFRERGITHLLAHVKRTRATFEQELKPEKLLLWNLFAQNLLVPLKQDGGFGLWELRSQ